MRDIKFRVWDKENKKMWKVYQLDFSKKGDYEFCHESVQILVYKTEWVWLADNENHLMQFTGLHDKNGKEIYRNDFIKDGYGNILLVDKLDGCWVLVHKPICRSEIEGDCRYDLLYNYSDTLEIMGNIYKNPELRGD